MPEKQRRAMVSGSAGLPITKQCDILGISRSTYYYTPRQESALNLELMSLMDRHYHYHSYKGAPRMHEWLTLDKGFRVSRNRVDRLYYEVMGLRAIMPGPHTSKRHKDQPVYPYLLRDLTISGPNHVWATDITYIPMAGGFMYLTALIDLYSRYVLRWSISNSMDAAWCAALVSSALQEYERPQIINTDQGVQYTSEVFTRAVLGNGIRLSMDGKGRATDNAFIERLWRTVKYENVRFKEYDTGRELALGMDAFFREYNHERRHSSIGQKRPKEVYYTG